MGVPLAADTGFWRFEVPLPGLLTTALTRLQKQSRYARPLSKGGKRAAGITAMLQQAEACVAALAQPEVVLMPVDAAATTNGICIADRVLLEGNDLAHDINMGGKVTAYLLTLGFDQHHAFDWLGGDYAAHHIQSDLASEVLFALGRQVFQEQKAQHPDARLRRIPVQTDAYCGQRRFWDAGKVQTLMQVFDGVNPGVTVTNTGCFQPLHALLGLTIRICDTGTWTDNPRIKR